MEKTLIRWQAAGFLFVCAAGTLLHFLYDWSGENPLTSVIAAVNESTWEHMKLLFFPMFFFALAEAGALGDRYQNFWSAKLIGILLGLALIPTLYYTYTGFTGLSLAWLNIAIFYVTALLVFLFERWAFKNYQSQCKHPRLAFAAICLIGLLFVVFTFMPPQIPLFQDPLSGTYGV
jgi:hypothetical protein